MNLNQVTIPALDVEKATEFYKTLGLRLIVDALPRYVRFECPDGDATFSIHKVDKLQKGYGTTIYFEENNLDAWVTQLQNKGITFNELPKDQSYLWREARLQDPDGNQIILYYAGKNRKNPPWRIN
ncbi:VOC family protein [Algibacter mikhailovii]|uniref:VOC domain-containing protein n=1 Tax=Algibacter mikhailovii TaxID=425498 RepID=A0A918R0B3_9FLAO|nr:VOC family protein [Algibacter mikhailovii]GGZ77097.1 hypothetical protein GCM10007028_12900 [Algibacter mikhailovii]